VDESEEEEVPASEEDEVADRRELASRFADILAKAASISPALFEELAELNARSASFTA
jgi:hypothetical protein